MVDLDRRIGCYTPQPHAIFGEPADVELELELELIAEEAAEAVHDDDIERRVAWSWPRRSGLTALLVGSMTLA